MAQQVNLAMQTRMQSQQKASRTRHGPDRLARYGVSAEWLA